MELSVIGMDIARNVFQLHCVDRQTGEIERIKLRRNEVLPYFARCTPAVVAMEALCVNINLSQLILS
jgi:transposase